MILTIIKGGQDADAEALHKKSEDLLQENIKEINNEMIVQNKSFKQFTDTLNARYHLIRDTITNMPIKNAAFVNKNDVINFY